MIKEFWGKYHHRIIHEVGYWLTIIIGFMAADGADVLIALYNGDFSDSVMGAFRMLIITSLVKVVLVMLVPSLFPLYRKDVGILPAKNNENE